MWTSPVELLKRQGMDRNEIFVMQRIKFIPVVWAFFCLGLVSCRDRAEDYKEELLEGVWYVADIDADYGFYSGLTPALKRYVRYLTDEKNLLFWPGDRLVFSRNRVNVLSPGDIRYDYDYFFEGKYVQVGDYNVYYALKPEGDNERMTLEFDKQSLRKLLNDQGEYELLEEFSNLKRFHIIYGLQRPAPSFARMMSGIYAGELYDGTGQLIYPESVLNLFWDGQRLNLSLDEQIILENGPCFYIEIPDLQVEEGFTPGSYQFFAGCRINDPNFGETEIQVEGRFHANRTVTMDIFIYYRGLVYQLQYLKGVRQWTPEMLAVRGVTEGLVLKPSLK